MTDNKEVREAIEVVKDVIHERIEPPTENNYKEHYAKYGKALETLISFAEQKLGEKPRLEVIDRKKIEKIVWGVFPLAVPLLEQISEIIHKKFGIRKVGVEEIEKLIHREGRGIMPEDRQLAQAIHDLIYKGE